MRKIVALIAIRLMVILGTAWVMEKKDEKIKINKTKKGIILVIFHLFLGIKQPRVIKKYVNKINDG